MEGYDFTFVLVTSGEGPDRVFLSEDLSGGDGKTVVSSGPLVPSRRPPPHWTRVPDIPSGG